MARFCQKCQTGTSSRTHRTKCLKRARIDNVEEEWAALKKLMAKMTEQIIKLEETVGLLAKSQCREGRMNVAFSQLRNKRSGR